MIGSAKIDTFSQSEYDDRIKKSGFGAQTGPMAPFWSADPIRLGPAYEGILFKSSVASYLMGTGPLTVQKIQGPTWLFVGLQNPKRLVIPMAVCRIGAAVAAVILVSAPSDLTTYAALNATGAIILLSWTVCEVRRLGIGWQLPSASAVAAALRESSSIFGASIAINAYTASNPLIVAAILGPAAAGHTQSLRRPSTCHHDVWKICFHLPFACGCAT